MSCLLDTSVLARVANKADAFHAQAVDAIGKLHRQGEALCISPQILIEFRSVATRPASVNGLGLSPAEASLKSAAFEAVFLFVEDTPGILPEWKRLVEQFAVTGKQAHDARIVAVCHVSGISHLLTDNSAHFARFIAQSAALNLLDPTKI